MKSLPHKTVERLSRYRRVLMGINTATKHFIYSHELAELLHITPVQVRRDMMLIGYTGTMKKGYDINELITLIGEIIDTDKGQKVAVIGIGNLGRAIIGYISGKRTKIAVVAAFDNNPEKTNRYYAGVACYDVEKLAEIIKKENITIGIITVNPESAAAIAETLVISGIKGILNYTSKPLNVTPNVYLEEHDIITSLEKVAFFVKKPS